MSPTMARRVWTLDAGRVKLDGGAMFGNAPRALWERWIEADERSRIPLCCRALLVQDQGRNILFEAGIGRFFPPRLQDRYGVENDTHELLTSLAAIDLAPDDIDIVVLSHLHFDHAGGLLSCFDPSTPLRLNFERATYLVGREAWRRACHPHLRDRASFIPELQVLLENSGRLEIVDGESHDTLGDGYRFRYSDGHTPGLMMSEIETTRGPLVYASDLVPGAPWLRLPITMGYDRYPEKLIDEKQLLFDDLIARGGRIVFTHDADIAVATLVRDEAGRYHTSEHQAALDGVVI
jgi:glyoxylase-like metal-dependent hydrolase (beta-lactamase superfamily II)